MFRVGTDIRDRSRTQVGKQASSFHRKERGDPLTIYSAPTFQAKGVKVSKMFTKHFPVLPEDDSTTDLKFNLE